MKMKIKVAGYKNVKIILVLLFILFFILMFFNYKYQKAQVELLEKRIKEKQ
ncbi:hypothetical protein [Campylobacter coli]|uniref:hypothetical protein n=1 Tax=Campylobacter coli TaxID=195 RepID=UPI001483A79F|nr:hypothetical protein [Campylobacter coli]